MKKPLQFLLFALLAIVLNSCFTPKPVYKLNINSIYKTTKIETSEINVVDNNIEDSTLSISITLNEMNDYFIFKIKNKSINEIFIKWDDARMIYKQDTSKLIFMNEESYDDLVYKNVLSQKKDTLGKTTISGFLYPINNFMWMPTNNKSGYWSFKELIAFPEETLFIKIPIEINGDTYTYIINYKANFFKYKNRYDPVRTNKALVTIGTVGTALYLVSFLIFL